jgi:hypothetical protein
MRENDCRQDSSPQPPSMKSKSRVFYAGLRCHGKKPYDRCSRSQAIRLDVIRPMPSLVSLWVNSCQSRVRLPLFATLRSRLVKGCEDVDAGTIDGHFQYLVYDGDIRSSSTTPVYSKPGIRLIFSHNYSISSRALVGRVRDLRCGQQPRFAPADRYRAIGWALVHCLNIGQGCSEIAHAAMKGWRIIRLCKAS